MRKLSEVTFTLNFMRPINVDNKIDHSAPETEGLQGKHTEKVFFMTEGGREHSASPAGGKPPQRDGCRKLLLLSERKVLRGQRLLPFPEGD